MNKDKNQTRGASGLRRRAEARLRAAKTKGGPELAEADLQRLVHELQVHQIELEMQNEELVQARAELEAALGEYSDLYDFAPVGYFSLDCDGAIRRVNLTGALLLGVERAGLTGRWFGSFVTVPDRTVLSAFLEKVFAGHAQEVCEVAIRGEGKGSLAVHITATVSQGGSECRLMMTDISKLRETEEAMRRSERRYRSFVELTSQWAWATDASGRVVEDLPALNKFAGLTFGQAKGAGWAVALHPEDRQHTIEVWNRAVSTKTPYEAEYRMRRHDGVYRHLLARGVPIIDEQGQVVEWVGTCVDITERKQIQEELQQLNLSLEERVVERTPELAHTVEVLQGEIEQRLQAEYELRLANEQLAQRADQLRRLAGQLTMVEQAERKRISKILHDGIQQLLVSAKLQLGGLAERIGDAEHKQEIDEVEKIISDSVSMSRTLSTELSPSVLHDGRFSDGLGWLARWMRDKHRLRVDLLIKDAPELREEGKVLMFESVREMLFNAHKHAKASSVRVSLEQADGGGLRIIVSDEGVGFDPSRLIPGGPEGGFGLFSIRERVSLIGGDFEIESTPGKGSRFTLNVPYSQAVFVSPPADEVCALPGPTPKGIVEDESLSIRLLLADDHALFRNGVARLLKHEPGLKIVGQAVDGREAIELAQKLKPHAILMDISMPGVNGIDATRTIHQKNPEICIIGLSMHQDPERELAMRDAGAADFKTKGCTAAELLAAIRAGLQTRKPLPK